MTELLDSSPRGDLLPMREVVRQTGVNPVTLRAWERRHGLIRPVRTEGGHRLYSPQDVQAIQRIMLWTSRGIAVGRIGELLTQHETDEVVPVVADDHLAQWRDLLREALANFDSAELERLYGQLSTLYPLAVLFEDVLLPLWRALLPRTEYGARSQWLMLDAFLRSRALLRLQMNRGNGPVVMLADGSGNCAELELLCAGLVLAGGAARVEVLAAGQPLDELPLICDARQPAVLVLFGHAPLPTEVVRRLQMKVSCPLAVAGQGGALVKIASVAYLGDSPALMQRRLQALLDGHLDT